MLLYVTTLPGLVAIGIVVEDTSCGSSDTAAKIVYVTCKIT